VGEWLRSNPSVEELRAAYPEVWSSVQAEIGTLLNRGDLAGLAALTSQVARTPSSARRRATSRADQDALIAGHIRRQLAADAIRQVRLSLSTGVLEGKVRFNFLNGWILQRLFFAHDLVRKPVSMRWFRLLWPLMRQRKYLLPLVTPKGIYCFYSRPLIEGLAAIIGDRPCLEIAAGDGTLARFLTAAGVTVTATDDHSWDAQVTFGDDVRKQDARTALRVEQPRVVICSFPPPRNRFERDVFATGSVETYIVIGSHNEMSTGDWETYRTQRTFTFTQDERLGALVLPPDLLPAVYVFQRTPTAH
jgi:hypothetical protein